MARFVSAVAGLSRRGQDQLIKFEIQPATEFETRLLDARAMDEAQAAMQGDAGGVGGVDAADHHVVILLGGGGDGFAEQSLTKALLAETLVDVHRVLDRIFIGREGAKGAITGEAHEFPRVINGADHGVVAFRFRLEPGLHHGGRARLVVVERGGVDDGFVQDGENRAGVGLIATDDFHEGCSVKRCRLFGNP